MTTPRRAVAAIILVDSLQRPRRFLAARRVEPPQLAGFWEFPGGKVEEGETSMQAARREALEELGIQVRLGVQLCRTDNGLACDTSHDDMCSWPLGDDLAMAVFFAESLEGTPRLVESHSELRWLPCVEDSDESQHITWIPADLPIVWAAMDRLRTGASVMVPGPSR